MGILSAAGFPAGLLLALRLIVMIENGNAQTNHLALLVLATPLLLLVVFIAKPSLGHVLNSILSSAFLVWAAPRIHQYLSFYAKWGYVSEEHQGSPMAFLASFTLLLIGAMFALSLLLVAMSALCCSIFNLQVLREPASS